MYRASLSICRVEEYEIVKTTEKTVTFKAERNERTEYKSTDYYKWSETFEGAKQHIVDHYSNKIKKLESSIEYQRVELNKAITLTPANGIN